MREYLNWSNIFKTVVKMRKIWQYNLVEVGGLLLLLLGTILDLSIMRVLSLIDQLTRI